MKGVLTYIFTAQTIQLNLNISFPYRGTVSVNEQANCGLCTRNPQMIHVPGTRVTVQ